MNKFMNGLKDATNLTFTENGAITHKYKFHQFECFPLL